MELNDISGRIIACALKVHSAIGPGVLESVYQTCLSHELQKAALGVRTQVALPVEYDGLRLDSGYRLDLLVEDAVIVELKCVEALLPIHSAQLLTYLRLGNKSLGLLLNFNVVHLREGIKRVLNNKYEVGIAAFQDEYPASILSVPLCFKILATVPFAIARSAFARDYLRILTTEPDR